MNTGEILKYQTPDGNIKIDVRLEEIPNYCNTTTKLKWQKK